MALSRALVVAVLTHLAFSASPAWAQATVPDPLLLPVATTAHVPLTGPYNALNVPALSAGGSYLDPTTGAKVYKLTSATFPAASPNWGHDYSEGGDEVSLPYNGNTRAVLVRQNGGPWWLVDFTPGVGVGNPRPLTGAFAPFMDIAFTFSNNPATPWYAYVSSGSTIRRLDIRTMTEAPGGGWPVTGESSAMWLHQSANDGLFIWMRGANGTTMVGFEPSTNTKKTYTHSLMNEPRIDRGGRYVGVTTTPGNGIVVWDFVTSSVVWSGAGDPGIPFAHVASLRRRWLCVDWNMGYPPDFTSFTSDVPNSQIHIGGPANGTLIHGNGNWIQNPPDLDDQWALFTHYGSLRPAESYWLAPGAFVMITRNGERRVLGHPYNSTTNYTFYAFPKFSPDGKYVLFTSNMNGSARHDVFLAELPQSTGTPDTSPPTVALTAPAAGAVVSGAAVAVSASASDDVGVAGVQFKLDGANLGAEDTSAPFGLSWNTLPSLNGNHTLTALARDAAGNSTTSSPVTVSVSNAVDVTPPVLGAIAASGIGPNTATVTWATDEPADSQVEYGPTTAYGSATTRDATLLTSHSQVLASLAPDTLYHYRVRSRDGAGNLAVSGDFTFTTLALAGPIAEWTLDEGIGGTTADVSGNGHTGSLTNGAAWSAGRRDQGVALDGVDDHVGVAHAGALNAFPMSAAAWFKTSTTAGVRGLLNKYVAGSYNGYQIFFDTGALCAWYLRDTSNYIYDGGGCTLRTPGYNDGLWHHVVFVADAAGGRLYVDGVQRGSQPWTGAAGAVTTTQDLRLGHYPGAFGGAEYLPGVVDEVRLYDRALSAEEVSALYAETPPGGDTEPPLLSLVGASGISGTAATVSWATDEPADSQVEYGPTTTYGSSTPLDPGLLTAHSLVLNGLSPATLYHYRVRSRDAAGNLAASGDFTFTTLDTVLPQVAVTAPAAGQTVAGMVALSASASDNVGVAGVQFRVDGVAVGAEDASAPYSVSWDSRTATNAAHTVTAVARDAAGNTKVSAGVAVTVSNTDATPPVISSVASSGVTSWGSTITWTTNEPADTQVEYGTTTAYGSSTTLEPTGVTAHAQGLRRLKASTLYHYRVRSRDAAGNLSVSSDRTFTSLAAPKPIGSWKLDEGTGVQAFDSSGNGRTGSLMNGPVWTAGRRGGALGLDGVNDHVRVPHADALNAYPLTVAAWFKTSSTSGVRGLVNKYVASSYNGYQVFFESGNLCAWYLRSTSQYVYDGTNCSLKTPGFNDGAWHQVAFVVDASGGKVYVDGVLKASRPWNGTAGPPTTSQELRFGHYPLALGGTEYLPGVTDEVAVYGRALNADEVWQLYQP